MNVTNVIEFMHKRKVPLLLSLFFYFLYFKMRNIDWLDKDAQIFSKIDASPLSFAIQRYKIWSSRFWIEGATLFSSHHLLIFCLITMILVFLLFYSMSQMLALLGFDNNYLFVLIFIAIFPINSLDSAGMIATIVNYIWPIALFSYWLMTDLQMRLEEISKTKKVISILFLILSVFNEGLAVVLLLYIILKAIVDRKDFINPYNISYGVISLLSILNILLAPGNHNRNITETAHWFPKFDKISLFDKILIQFNNISVNLIDHYGLLLTFLALLLIIKASQERKILLMVLAGLAVLLGNSYQKIISTNLDKIIENSSKQTFSTRLIDNLMGQSFVFAVIIGLIAAVIFLLYGKSKESLLLIGALGITFSSAMAAALSPTLLASLDRPLIPLYIVLTFSCIFLANDIISVHSKTPLVAVAEKEIDEKEVDEKEEVNEKQKEKEVLKNA
ncbi:DUF6056 family protein [Lactococcus kimchii]|uniref:DUF6056 family protein n=1 Tax=Lactococcus sp. S-13 TaxID=2507158 RepID=UPI001680D5B2|nr:hypothetical protein [Lactococcus sp. S-13]